MRALEGQQLLEDDPTVMYLTAYLLTLDAQYDFLARHHRQMIVRAEDAEKSNSKLHVDLTTAQARVAALGSREVIAIEALKQAKDEHVQKLMEAYLVTHNQRRALRIQEPASSNPVQPMRAKDPQILEGHPVLETKKSSADSPALRPDGPRSGQSAVMARTVRACAESVRVPSLSRDLLSKTAGLTWKSVGSGSRPPPLYR
jgi:hypothetical protein